MANTASAKKRALTNEVRRQRNVARRSELKTASKKVFEALSQSNLEQAKVLLIEVESKLARAKGKGVLKGNAARRKISRLAKRVAKASKTPAA